MRMPQTKTLFAIAAVLCGALLVLAGLALNAENTRPSPGVSPSESQTSTISEPPASAPTSTESVRPRKTVDGVTSAPSKTSRSNTTTPKPRKPSSTPGGPSQAPSDRSTCPVTTNGTTKCPEDPYCPGGEFCPGDNGEPTAAPSDWSDPSPSTTDEVWDSGV